MVIAVDANDAEKAIEVLNAQGEKAWKIGHIQEASLITA
ncbi:AIR synthase-related protein [Acinetobacter baumannii]